MMRQPVDAALLEATLKGDSFARDQLCARWLPVVTRWCVRMGGSAVDPDDAASDVFICMLTRLDRLRNPECFDAWLYGITRRTLAAHRRRAWIKRWVPGVFRDPDDPSARPDIQAEVSDTTEKLNRILEELTANQREVLVLCDVEERTDEEVAHLLGIPTGTVKSRLRLARQSFRVACNRHGLVTPLEPALHATSS
jgi:RNA polymerase sigma-70 factor (ECF subfamily)